MLVCGIMARIVGVGVKRVAPVLLVDKSTSQPTWVNLWVHLEGSPIGRLLLRTYERTNERISCFGHKPYVTGRTREGTPKVNPAEAARIVETAATIWPNVKDTTTTREAWFLALARTNFYDAMDAVGSLAGERKTVHVSDVVKRAERIRLSLVRSLPPVPDPPVELADDPQAEQLWLRVAQERQLSLARMERHAVPA